MIHHELDIQTPDGKANAHLYRGGTGALPGILLYPDAAGVRPVMQEMAQRLAGLGYAVLLPNIFYRTGEFEPFSFAKVMSDPAERERLMKMVHSLTNDRVLADSKAYLDALTAQPDVRAIGATGYCMGGRLAFLTACWHPDRVRAAAAFHPGGLVTDAPDSPHRLAKDLRAAVHVGLADKDLSPEQQGTLATALGERRYQLERHPDMKHGWAVSDHVVFDKEGSERHWRRTEAFFRENLS